MQFEAKLKGNIADARLNLVAKIEANFEEEKAKQEELGKRLRLTMATLETMESREDAQATKAMILGKMAADVAAARTEAIDTARQYVAELKADSCEVPGLIGNAPGDLYVSLPQYLQATYDLRRGDLAEIDETIRMQTGRLAEDI